MPEVEVEVQHGVGVITLAAPARKNALTVGMARGIVDACDAMDANQSVGVVVVRGSGGFFCSGADRDLLFNTTADPSSKEAFEQVAALYRSFTRVLELKVPTIAAVRGGAVGAGVNLLLSCGLRVVGRDARIVPGFQRIGLHPGGGHLALLNRAGGYEAALAIGVLGQEISGEDAARLRVAWEAVPDAEVDSRAMELGQAGGTDPELTRLVYRSFQQEVGPPPIPLAVALDVERGAQLRTQRRLAEGHQ